VVPFFFRVRETKTVVEGSVSVIIAGFVAAEACAFFFCWLNPQLSNPDECACTSFFPSKNFHLFVTRLVFTPPPPPPPPGAGCVFFRMIEGFGDLFPFCFPGDFS